VYSALYTKKHSGTANTSTTERRSLISRTALSFSEECIYSISLFIRKENKNVDIANFAEVIKLLAYWGASSCGLPVALTAVFNRQLKYSRRRHLPGGLPHTTP
jgi:hypothetical protein